KRARVKERRYTGPEERVEPGLLHEVLEATDADGMTAEEALLQDGAGQPAEEAIAGSQEQAGSAAEAEASAAEAPPAEAPEATADAQTEDAPEATAEDSPSDAPDAEQGVLAGDPPA